MRNVSVHVHEGAHALPLVLDLCPDIGHLTGSVSEGPDVVALFPHMVHEELA